MAEYIVDIQLVDTKKPAKAGFFREHEDASGGFEGLDVRAQAALMTGSLVLVDQATRRITVQHRQSADVSGFSGGGILGVQGLDDFLHQGAQHRAVTGVARITDFGLLGALFSRFDIGHSGLLENVDDGVVRKIENYDRNLAASQ